MKEKRIEWFNLLIWRKNKIKIWHRNSFSKEVVVLWINIFPSLLYQGCFSVLKSCPTLWNPMNCSTPGFPVLHYFPEFAKTHVRWVSDAIQPSHPLSPPFPLVLNLSFPALGSFPISWLFKSGGQSIGASASVLSFQYIFRVDFL